MNRHHSAFPHRWPIHEARTQVLERRGSGMQGSAGCLAPAADRGEPPATPLPSKGELAASPWLGLHY
ncbi:MAG: hypothetical protein ACXVYB_09610, partial [Arthrobacter sp.]